MLFWICLHPRYIKIPEFFTIAPVLTSTLMVCSRNRGDPLSLYRTCVTSITKTVVLVWRLEPPTRRSRSKSALKCINQSINQSVNQSIKAHL